MTMAKPSLALGDTEKEKKKPNKKPRPWYTNHIGIRSWKQ